MPSSRPSVESDVSKRSSADNSVLIVISGILAPPKPLLSNSTSISFGTRLNKKGDKLSPCRTPNLHS